MNKTIILILLFIMVLFTGCNEIDLSQVSDSDLERISDKAVVCNEPYMRLGATCCLDSNSDGVCDNDEQNNSNDNALNNININSTKNNTNEFKEFKKEKLDLLVKEGTNKFILNTQEYSLEVQDVLSNGLYKVKLNGIEKTIVNPFEKIEFDGIYFILKNSVESEKEGNKGYAEVVVSNYDYKLQPKEVSCFETDGGIDIEEFGTTYGLSDNLNEFISKEDICKDTKNIIEYHCGDKEEVVGSQKYCEYGCEEGECLSIADVGCDKDDLGSGLIILAEGNSFKLNMKSIEVIKVAEDFAELKIDGDKKYVEICEKITYEDLIVIIHNIVESTRKGVSGYIELSYEHNSANSNEDDNNDDDNDTLVDNNDNYNDTQESVINDNPTSNTIALGDYEETTLNLGNGTYNVEIIKINQQNATISVNGISKIISIYSGDFIGDVYVYINDLVYSSRDAVKSYVELIVSLQEVQGDFFCSDTGSNVIAYSDSSYTTIVSESDYCIDDTLRKDYFCSDDEKTIDSSTQNCPYGCSNGKCDFCSIKDGEGLENTFSIGEGDTEVITVGEQNYTFTLISMSDSKVLLKYNYDTMLGYDVCSSFEKGDVKFQINDIITSSREGVKGYAEIGYE